MYFGLYFERYLLENDIVEQDVMQLRKVMCSYYIELCVQIGERFNLSNDELKFFKYLNPKNVIDGIMPSVLGLTKHFSPTINNSELELINNEWRKLIGENQLLQIFKTDDIVSQWLLIKNLKDGMDNLIFENISSYMLELCCLPHSSAAAERKFSDLKNIKNEKRNKLKTTTVHNILAAREISVNFQNFNPPEALLKYASKFKFSGGLYSKK